MDLASPGQLLDGGLKGVAFLSSSLQFSEVGVICPFYPCGTESL